ncbi:MAG TPA: DUF4402 domain-containing protein [Bacteroidales bacterium]|nr:DUF4402 domain-containing protein [Bacteroidales bacterium]
MRRLNILIFSLVCLFNITGGRLIAQVTTPVNATGHIIAEIIPVFSASETSQMNFGRFAPGPQGGEIILTPENTISVLGSVYKGVGTHNAASFYVSGDVNAAYSITLPASPVILTHIGNIKTMLVKDWVSIPSPGLGAGMLQDGFQNVYVGATLKVGTLYDNPVGIYTGSYIITFDFN